MPFSTHVPFDTTLGDTPLTPYTLASLIHSEQADNFMASQIRDPEITNPPPPHTAFTVAKLIKNIRHTLFMSNKIWSKEPPVVVTRYAR